MTTRGEGIVERREFLELRDRVSQLEKTVADLARTKFNQQETHRNKNGDENVDGSTSERGGSTAGNQEGDFKNFNEDIEIKEEVEIKEDMEEDPNDDGDGNNPRVISDETWVVRMPQIPEAFGISNEKGRTSAAEADEGVDDGLGSKDLGGIPPPITTRITRTAKRQSEVKHRGVCMEQESPKTQKPSKQSSPKKESTTVKTTSLGKSPGSSQNHSKKKLGVISTKPQWKCPQCPRSFSYKSDLKKHSFIHTDEHPFLCPHCPAAMKREHSLILHIRTVHPKENKNLLPCRICQEKFPSKRILLNHMRKHWKCYFCSHTVKVFYDMRHHLPIHTGEKPFSCPHCSYSTSLKQNLKVHILAKHTSSTKVSTEEEKRLKEHKKKKIGLKSILKPLKCPHCPKTVICKSQLATGNAHP